MARRKGRRALPTSPRRGEVAEPTGPAEGRLDDKLREAGGGESKSTEAHPTPAASPPTLPLQGRVEGRCGFVALIGAPNAGKSTLTNALVGSKVSIVSRKVQTTRALVRGIAMVGDVQLVLMDTPGIFAPRRRLERAMVTTAWGGAPDADIVALLIDAKKGIDV